QKVSGATDLFGKKLFAQYVAAKQAGQDTSANDTQQYIVGQVLGDGTLLPTAKIYDKSSFTIIPNNDIAAIKTYANNIAVILNTHQSNNRYELAIVEDSLDKNKPEI